MCSCREKPREKRFVDRIKPRHQATISAFLISCAVFEKMFKNLFSSDIIGQETDVLLLPVCVSTVAVYGNLLATSLYQKVPRLDTMKKKRSKQNGYKDIAATVQLYTHKSRERERESGE